LVDLRRCVLVVSVILSVGLTQGYPTPYRLLVKPKN